MEHMLRIALAVPHVHLGNPEKNTLSHISAIQDAQAHHASLILFPELSMTGYTCGDLFYQASLLQAVQKSIVRLTQSLPDSMIAVVGAPLETKTGLLNGAFVLGSHAIYGFVPKQYIPNSHEFYEKRYFQSGRDCCDAMEIGGMPFAVSPRTVFRSQDGVMFGIEICEDLWSPIPPSSYLALAGAELVLNLSASNELITKREYRTDLVRQQSARLQCAYAYVSAGLGESTSDLVFSGHSLVTSCGSTLAENAHYLDDDYRLYADIDLDRIRADRRGQTSFLDAAQRMLACPSALQALPLPLMLDDRIPPSIHPSAYPFIPADSDARDERCSQIFDLQSAALARRLAITGGKVVVGISGGLDSTLALLAACRAMDRLQLPRTHILGITMPCFGTTDRTYQNALTLMDKLHVSSREIPIHEAVRLHFRDIGHDERDHSVTYENAQARERTQVLMDVANDFGGIVLGTGDLSEIALGWCTYNADHMSMYGVNSGVPKTLVRWIIQTVCDEAAFRDARDCLLDILDTPISPELLPPDTQGQILQKTEDLVGPYTMHDFFLYYVIRLGYTPRKIYAYACLALEGMFSHEEILHWLRNFYRRFFTQQFKRNCMPDGVKIGSIALSPRGDWRMPSDAEALLWLTECEALTEKE